MAKLCLLTIKIYWKFNKSFPLPKLYNIKFIYITHLILSTSKNVIWFLIWCSYLFLCCGSRTYQKLIKDRINIKLRLILERTALTITYDTSTIQNEESCRNHLYLKNGTHACNQTHITIYFTTAGCRGEKCGKQCGVTRGSISLSKFSMVLNQSRPLSVHRLTSPVIVRV
jgi:hypothetical protein